MTASGIADPLGPIMLADAMVVASSVHRKQGPLAQNGSPWTEALRHFSPISELSLSHLTTPSHDSHNCVLYF
jgi:hypothetical protein